VSEHLTLLRGIGKDGETVVFFDGGISGDTLVVMAEEWSGDKVGEPAVGTFATPIAELGTALTFKAIDDGEMLFVEASDDQLEQDADGPEDTEVDPEIAKVQKLFDEQPATFLFKAEAGDEGIAIGIVLEPNDGKDGAPFEPDTQNDVYNKADVEKAAYVWMLNGGAVDLLHSWQKLGKEEIIGVVGSDVTHGDVEFEKPDGTKQKVRQGTWLVTTLWNTKGKVWPLIKSGKLGAYSIGGTATEQPIEQPSAEG